MYNVGILVIAIKIGIYDIVFGDNFNGNIVSLYHVSACILGDHHKLFNLGPKAMALDTIQHHKLADNAKIIRIHIRIECLNM